MTDDIDLVRQICDAMAAKDFATLFELLDPGIVVTQDPALPWGGRHVGHDGFAEFGLGLTGSINSAVTHEAFFVADGDVYQVGRTRGTTTGSGRSFDIPEVHRWTVRDGKAVAAHFAIDTPAMLDALG